MRIAINNQDDPDLYQSFQGGNVSKALECIVQSEYLDVQHDLRTMMPAGKLFLGAAFERLGKPSNNALACSFASYLLTEEQDKHISATASTRPLTLFMIHTVRLQIL